jgi:hypothetical protein
VVMGALRWRHLWRGRHVTVHTDSTVTQGVINSGTARNSTCLHLPASARIHRYRFRFHNICCTHTWRRQYISGYPVTFT